MFLPLAFSISIFADKSANQLLPSMAMWLLVFISAARMANPTGWVCQFV